MSILRVVKKINVLLSNAQRVKVGMLAFLMVVGGILEMGTISLVLPFMNAALNPETMMNNKYVRLICDWLGISDTSSLLVLLSVSLASLFLLKNVYLMFEYNLQYKFTYNNMLAMQKRLLKDFLYRQYEYYLSINSGDIIRIINVDVNEGFYILIVLLEILTELIVSVMLVISLFIITPSITTAISISLGLILFSVMKIIKPILYKVGKEQQRTSTGMYKWLLQGIQGIKEIKISGKENYIRDNFDKYGDIQVKVTRQKNILTILPKFIIEAISMSTMFVLIAILIIRGHELDQLIPILAAVAMVAVRLLPSVNRISNCMGEIAYREPKLDRVISYINERDERGLIETDFDGNCKLKQDGIQNMEIEFKSSIELNNISYRYPSSEKYILKKANLIINKGDSIGIVGASGAGKSTTIDILLGLLDPEEGCVLVDGMDISVNKRQWHRLIGYIPQSIFMLDATIRSNVAFGIEEEKIDDSAVWESLQEASIADFIRSLPDGLDTQIGERGVRLSGGQKQRIGIARALYAKPEVLVFDEATSALDNATEAEVMESVTRLMGKRTIIIIAHRLSTIENCRCVYRVEEGKITKER